MQHIASSVRIYVRTYVSAIECSTIQLSVRRYFILKQYSPFLSLLQILKMRSFVSEPGNERVPRPSTRDPNKLMETASKSKLENRKSDENQLNINCLERYWILCTQLKDHTKRPTNKQTNKQTYVQTIGVRLRSHMNSSTYEPQEFSYVRSSSRSVRGECRISIL